MSVTAVHPQYATYLEDWQLMRRSFEGERVIKSHGVTYLPATDLMNRLGMTNATDPGRLAYEAYKERAPFPDLVRSAVVAMTGLLNKGKAQIELPERLEPMRERSSNLGEDLDTLLRRIHEEIFKTGRFGLLLDVPEGQGAGALPFIATYSAERIVNWDDGKREDGLQELQMVVLDESEFERLPMEFNWEYKQKFRVLALGETGNLDAGQYGSALMTETTAEGFPTDFITPELAGTRLDRIPFVFINPNDIVSGPDRPPLLGLGNRGRTIYGGEADYRHTLFLQGQETLMIKGSLQEDVENQPLLGASAILYLDGEHADAKYVGVSAEGLAEMREALQNDYEIANRMGAQILDRPGRSVEAHETLRIRIASRTTTLLSIAETAAYALQEALRIAAIWVGANPDEVIITPSKDFVETEPLTGEELLKYTEAKRLGSPISNRSIHGLMRDRDITEMSYEDELEEIAQEEPLEPAGLGVPGDDDDEGQEDDQAEAA